MTPSPYCLPQIQQPYSYLANGPLSGGIANGVENYLPGYQGAKAMLVTDQARDHHYSGDVVKNADGTTTTLDANRNMFQAQKMRLVLDGVGGQVLRGAGNATVTFEIGSNFAQHQEQRNGTLVLVITKTPMVTSIPGYAGNASDLTVDTPGHKEDYSFDPTKDAETASTVDTNKDAETPGIVNIEDSRSWTPFWCKDYGGRVTIFATVMNAAGDKILHTFSLTIPVDANDNGIADSWERQEYAGWKKQTGEDPNVDPLKWITADVDADRSINEPSLTVGDGLSAAYEYRGVIVDGGGQTPDGKNSRQGHIRLSSNAKEVLIDVDEMGEAANPSRPTTALPKGAASPQKVRDWMEAVTAAYSQKDFGAGIYGYYVLHDTNALSRNFAHYQGGKLYADIHSMWQDEHNYVQALRRPVNGVPIHDYWRHLTIGLRPAAIDEERPAFLDQAHHRFLSGVAGMSNNGQGPVNERIGSFFFADESYSLWKGPGVKLLQANGINPDDKNLPYTFDGYAVGVISHELAHQYQNDRHNTQGGHYKDADGDGKQQNTASDMRSVLFAYDQNPFPPGYYAQDYWQPIHYGQGYNDGFLPHMDLSIWNMMDVLDEWEFPKE